jgi:hypothetical protein
MNKPDSIMNTAIITWSDDDDCFVATSPLEDGISGVGDTREAALASFRTHVTEHYKAYKAGKHAVHNRKVGRPAKGNITVAFEIRPEVRDEFKTVASALGITQGEALQYLLARYRAV